MATTKQFEYATTEHSTIAHAVVDDEGVSHAACRRNIRITARRHDPRYVDRSAYMMFCYACDKKVPRVACNAHGMFNGTDREDCPECVKNREWSERHEARIASNSARGLAVNPTNTAPADQRSPRFETFMDGSLERERPISGTSLRSVVTHRPARAEGYGESWNWSRTIRGKAYQFNLVRMQNGQIRIFVKRFNGYVGGPRFAIAWTRVREIIFTPEVKQTSPVIVGCVHVGLGEKHAYQPGTDADLDDLYNDASEPCMRPEDDDVHQVDDALRTAVTVQEVIKARRQRALDTARCRGCGTTREVCREGSEGKPLGPEALCCSKCHHDPAAGLDALVKEIIAGDVKPPSDWAPGAVLGLPHRFPMRPPADWFIYQAEWWKPRDGRMVKIADMDPEWRYNCAAMLLRDARWHALCGRLRMSLSASGPFGPSGDAACDAFEREMDGITGDPEGWLRQTPLYRALTDGLPTGKKKLARLQGRAKHWNTCPVRAGLPGSCTCPQASTR